MEDERSSLRCKYKGIFGSPEEPFFNDKNYGVAPDILKEWLIELNLRNKEVIENADLKQDYFYHSDAICFIFKTCENFKLQNNVKYHAAELFERFMLKHVQDLYEHLRTTEPKNKLLKWEEILARIQNQALLRLVSCCQISSKMVSHYKLRNMIALTAITGILIICLITLHLGYNEPSLNVKPYHAVSMKVMDVVYLKKREIYEELFLVITRHLTPTFPEMQSFYKVKTDQILLAISVLAAAVYIADRPSTDMVIQQLHMITKRTSDDILDFATVIVQSVMEGGGDMPNVK
ncbi:hypothetical protein LOTGIDRAFT_160299 [Lottia gigantea]|uniref:Cyclin N-terminal domain-containing protein n=1 Tax=Lottia gigantea TaxID=225164 RepID=V4C2K7_LOTGI|nr:hypothetical protein LOTGIDRAFT_160299 [Lottia gigantea]ESO95754.1 hypothetical protein LOTGIDRAFT_160299 [Lottia gigantea]